MSENNKRPDQRRTEGVPQRRRPADLRDESGARRPHNPQRGDERSPVRREARGDRPLRQRPAQPQKTDIRRAPSNTARAGRSLPEKRKTETSLSYDERENKGLKGFVRNNLLATSKEKDERWEAQSIQRQRHGVDRPMLIIILVILALGTIMVFSASFPSALSEKGDSYYYIRNQLLWVAIGGAVMILLSFFNYKFFKMMAIPAAVVAIVLLVLVLIMGTARGVAQRWLSLGFISFQPSELAKAAMILVLAFYIDKYYGDPNRKPGKVRGYLRTVINPMIIFGVFCGLVLLEKHLSGTIILGLIGVAIVFFSGTNILAMSLTYGTVAGLAGFVYLMNNDYAMERILTHQDENADVLDEAWQTTQGLLAIGNGGLFGVGLGESDLKYNYVSEAHNDFIFTIWCEEMGFIGAILLIGLYGLFVWRGITIAKKAPDAFSSLTAFGITFQVGIQSALNIMVVTNIIPNTGVSLPFFSYGGTSLIILMAEMGVLLSISKHSYQKK
ncbi:MAG: cell division protein FtsW [Clostridia bacterium]|nr:cell division protein FtsW [Clostridia bacterium]